jgi:hypothetical protein
MSDYGTLESRVRRKSLLNKVMKPEDTIMDRTWYGPVSPRPVTLKRYPSHWLTTLKPTTYKDS